MILLYHQKEEEEEGNKGPMDGNTTLGNVNGSGNVSERVLELN